MTRSLGSRYIDMSKLDADRQKSKEQRLMPEYIEKFFVEAYRSFGGTITPVKEHTRASGRSAACRRISRKLPGRWNGGSARSGSRTRKITFDKEQSQGYSEVEFVGPGPSAV